MNQIVVVTRDAQEHVLTGEPGLTVMEIIRDNGFDELMALCGGSCSCATCHVHVSPEDWARLGAVGVVENDLLDTSEYRTDFSRLSCQIRFDETLDGVRVTIAAED